MPRYKYTIHDRLRKLSVEDYELALKFLPGLLKVHPQTFRNWIYIQRNSSAEIASGYLFKIALFLECTPMELHSDWEANESQIMIEWEKYKAMQIQISTPNVQG